MHLSRSYYPTLFILTFSATVYFPLWKWCWLLNNVHEGFLQQVIDGSSLGYSNCRVRHKNEERQHKTYRISLSQVTESDHTFQLLWTAFSYPFLKGKVIIHPIEINAVSDNMEGKQTLLENKIWKEIKCPEDLHKTIDIKVNWSTQYTYRCPLQ